MRLTSALRSCSVLLLLQTAFWSPAVDASWVKVAAENSFNDVALTQAEHQALVQSGSAPFWGHTGPKSVFLAWNSAAFDAVSQRLYFIGGGHADYGGNEVYAFDLVQNRWLRLSMPEALTQAEPHSQVKDKLAYLPANSPLSPHTYDGLSWNPKTRSLWLASEHGFGGTGMPPHKPATSLVWEFSPAAGSWKKYPISYSANWPKTVALGNTGKTLVIDYLSYSYHRAFIIDEAGNEQLLGKVEGLDNTSEIGTLFSNPVTGQLYSAHQQGIYRLTLQGNKLSAQKAASFPSLAELHLNMDYRQAGYAYRPQDGKFYIWNGGPHLLSWSPNSGQFEVIWHQGGEAPDNSNSGAGRVFDKFVYLASEDAFVGVMNGEDGQGSNGVWKWLPHSNAETIYQLTPDALQLDGVSQQAVSLLLPIKAGDRNYNSKAQLFYRSGTSGDWSAGVELLRLRPELSRNSKNQTGLSPEGFAGMQTGLSPNTRYQFKVVVTDPDGVIGDSEQLIALSTRQVPTAALQSRLVPVHDSDQLRQALAKAMPGDLIQLAPGSYAGSFTLSRSGTPDNPITLRGTLAALTTLDGTGEGKGLTIAANHLRVENLTLQGAATGIAFSGSRLDVALQDLWIKQVRVGIYALGGQQQLYIANNVLAGGVEPGDVSNETWNYEGIVVTGQEIEVANNTLSGFGDSLGLHWSSPLANKAIHFHHNQVLWSGDDGLEFDFALRNVNASHNLLLNVANGLSFQPVWGGPVYAVRNLVINAGRGPLKIKPEQDNPNGILILHNTFVRSKSDILYGGNEAWSNSSGLIRQLYVKNNLFISPSQGSYVLRNESQHELTELSHNGWSASGRFVFYLANQPNTISVLNFEQWRAGSFGQQDQLLSQQRLFRQLPLVVDSHNFADTVLPEGLDLSPAEGSAAIDKALPISGINPLFRGNGPDLGAVEQGAQPEQYGATLRLTPPDDNYPINDNARTDMNGSVLISPLDNDFLVNSDAPVQLTLLQLPDATQGKVDLLDNNVLRFTPTTGFTGTVVLSYSLPSTNTAMRLQTALPVAQINIRVTPPNSLPQAVTDSFELFEGNTLSFNTSDLLKNDSDADGDLLQVSGIGQPGHGQLQQNGQQLTYTPKAGFIGQDSFSYQLSDGQGAVVSGQVLLNVMSNGTIIGTIWRDYIDMSGRSDGFMIYGKGGPDIITGSAGDDTISGDEHEDRINAGPGNDIILFSGQDPYHDWVDGGAGFDEIRGDDGDTRIGLYEVTNIERINGGDGFDVITGTLYRQIFDFSNTELISIELIDGGEHDDIIIGSAGNDTFKGGAGNDSLDGGPGVDTVLYDLPVSSYQLSRRAGVLEVKALSGNEGTDQLKNIEFLQFKDQRLAVSDIR